MRCLGKKWGDLFNLGQTQYIERETRWGRIWKYFNLVDLGVLCCWIFPTWGSYVSSMTWEHLHVCLHKRRKDKIVVLTQKEREQVSVVHFIIFVFVFSSEHFLNFSFFWLFMFSSWIMCQALTTNFLT